MNALVDQPLSGHREAGGRAAVAGSLSDDLADSTAARDGVPAAEHSTSRDREESTRRSRRPRVRYLQPGVYDVPHFDVHFYMEPIANVFADVLASGERRYAIGVSCRAFVITQATLGLDTWASASLSCELPFLFVEEVDL